MIRRVRSRGCAAYRAARGAFYRYSVCQRRVSVRSLASVAVRPAVTFSCIHSLGIPILYSSWFCPLYQPIRNTYTIPGRRDTYLVFTLFALSSFA